MMTLTTEQIALLGWTKMTPAQIERECRNPITLRIQLKRAEARARNPEGYALGEAMREARQRRAGLFDRDDEE